MSNIAKIAALLQEIGMNEEKISRLSNAKTEIIMHQELLQNGKISDIEISEAKWRGITVQQPKEISNQVDASISFELQKGTQAITTINSKIQELKSQIINLNNQIDVLKKVESES